MKPLRILVAEDSDDDFLLLRSQLERGGFEATLERIETAEEMRTKLESSKWDLIISDYTMPQFDALSALQILQKSRQRDVPLIIVSGSIGEVRAVAALKAGAADYVMKANLEKLVPVVEREIKDAQTRRERREAFDALRLAVKARDEFLSIASHELKTPLTSMVLQIHGLLKTLRNRKGTSSASDQQLLTKAEAIARSSDRLTELVDRLLDITRLATGKLDLSLENVNLATLARNVGSKLGARFEAEGSILSMRVPDALNGHWDRLRLEMVLSNLLTNAAKFGLGKPVDLEVEDAGRAAVIRVIDHGIGISPADQQRIFGRFERAVSERHYGGFGVGLWLCQQIVQAHGGKIEVASAPAMGSTFTITLPKEPDS